MKKLIKLFITTISIIAVIFTSSIIAFAVDSTNSDNCSLTVTFQSGDVCIPNSEFSLYKVADGEEVSEYTLTSDFSGFKGDFCGFENSDEMKKAAKRLATYVSDNKIKPIQQKKTNKNGKVKFNIKNNSGLYLVLGSNTKFGDYKYRSLPTLVSVPEKYGETVSQDVNLVAKAERERVDEEKPVPPEHLPYTGMLWWPVPVLLILGLIFIIIGVVDRLGRRYEK